MTALRPSRLLLLAGWLTGLAVTALLLARLGTVLPPLPASGSSFRTALDHDGVALVALAVLRPVALVLVGYQVVITVLASAGAITSSTTLLALSRRAPGSVARSVVRHAVGAGLTATAVTALAPAAAFAQTPGDTATTAPTPVETGTPAPSPTTPPGEPILMVRLPDPARSPTDTREDAEEPAGTAVMVSLDPTADPPAGASAAPDGADSPTPSSADTPADDVDDDSATATATMQSDEEGAPSTASDPGEESPSDRADETSDHGDDVDRDDPRVGSDVEASTSGDTWRIEAGDHLWSIAAETLADEWGRTPSDDDVLHYWDALLAANRDRLVDPANPDLVFPGQVLVLPEVPDAVAIGG